MATGLYGGACVEKHTAFIFDRGGQRRVGPILDISSITWERARDNVSEAVIRIEGDACDAQAEFIASIRVHRHELVIYRGNERVFEGPVHRIGSYRSYTDIVAKDVSEYLFHTPLSKVWDNTNEGVGVQPVTTRMQNIIEYEMTTDRVQVPVNSTTPIWVTAWENLDPPTNVLPYLTIHHFPNEAGTSAKTKAFEMTVGDHLANYAHQGGIDWVTVGRAIHIWDVSRSIGRLPQMTEADFNANVVVTEYGSDHTQSAYVIGNEGTVGSAVTQEYLDYYGPWTDVNTAYNEEGTEEPTVEELRSQAVRNLSGRSPVPIEVRIPDNSSIFLNPNLTINMLVPGVQVPLRAMLNSRPLSQMQKIDHLSVSESGLEGEQIKLILTPTTRPDSDVEEEED